MVTLSKDQEKALNHILEWYKKDRNSTQFVTLGGYAGTGKTTLIAFLRRELSKIEKDLNVGFASYTGKAARVLKTKLKEQNTLSSDDCVDNTLPNLLPYY